MAKKFKLKLVNLKESLEKGDLGAISARSGVSVVTIQNMFKVEEFRELKPAMKIALDATINYINEKKVVESKMIEKLMDV